MNFNSIDDVISVDNVDLNNIGGQSIFYEHGFDRNSVSSHFFTAGSVINTTISVTRLLHQSLYQQTQVATSKDISLQSDYYLIRQGE